MTDDYIRKASARLTEVEFVLGDVLDALRKRYADQPKVATELQGRWRRLQADMDRALWGLD